uniref:procathepsin L-like n=1 Tax=Jaculus jaculus TaxID=51337 RepID=UPI001E1B0014|nr:procathepsin L-like [Jaculus jaculus]
MKVNEDTETAETEKMASASPTFDPSLDAQWLKWKTQHGKTYTLSEEEHKRAVWQENMRKIELHNKEFSEGKHSYTMEMNAFGDLHLMEKMPPLCLLIPLYVVMASATPTLDPSLDAQWLNWKRSHGKTYTESEEHHRRAVWEKNMQMIELHNREYSEGKHSYTMEMNAFGDLNSTEFENIMGDTEIEPISTGKVFQKRQVLVLPKIVDWRKNGYVAPVFSQGPCKSCWAFSVVGALEGQMARKTGKLVLLSKQNLVDCSGSHGTRGCKGGRMSYAIQYIMDNGGINTESSYPYEGKDGPCRYKPENSAANVTGFVRLPPRENALMHAVATVGPISAAVFSGLNSFQFYKQGIYSDPRCVSKPLTHAVLVVGYGFEGEESDGKKYWLIKNSWGKIWGMRGYMKLAKDKNNLCGIASKAIYLTV